MQTRYFASRASSGVSMRERCEVMSAPSSAAAVTAFPLAGRPSEVYIPALSAASPVFSSPPSARKNPSAIGERHVLPVQIKTI